MERESDKMNDFPADHPVNSLPKEAMKEVSYTKFAPKLTFDQRCTALALDKVSVHRNIIAELFGVDRRTVSHICNAHSTHYRSVRDHYKRMGHEAFITEYVTPETVGAIKLIKIRMPSPDNKKPVMPSVKAGVPNPRATKSKGLHTVKPEQCSYTHRVEIQYQADMVPAGWYYRDLDSKSNKDAWLHNGTESLLTSQAALSMAVANLMDD